MSNIDNSIHNMAQNVFFNKSHYIIICSTVCYKNYKVLIKLNKIINVSK